MSKPDFKAEADGLAAAINAQLAANGEKLAAATYDAAKPLIIWLDYLRASEKSGCCDDLLESLRAAIVETVGCISMGLTRPAIFSLRGQIDIALSWLFFKDHPVEWNRVQELGEGFMLKAAVFEYLGKNFAGFNVRQSMLEERKRRTLADPYKVLSAHVHSQSPQSAPAYGHLRTLVRELKRCQEAVLLQTEVSEFVSDLLFAVFSEKWASLPKDIVKDVKARLGVERFAKFLS